MIVEFILYTAYDDRDYLFHSENFPMKPSIGEYIFIGEFQDIMKDNAYEHIDIGVTTSVSNIRKDLPDDYIVSQVSHCFSSSRKKPYLIVTLETS